MLQLKLKKIKTLVSAQLPRVEHVYLLEKD
jgi:hypothetical protein